MNNGMLSIMTWNIYFGASLLPVLNSTPEEVNFRITDVFRQFLATNFPKRAEAIANIIYESKPDIIGLQEAAIWTLISDGLCEYIVEYDFTDILIRELEKLGMVYEIQAINENYKTKIPSSDGNLVSLQDRDVILVKKSSSINIIDRKEANYMNNSILSITERKVSILKGWSYIDFDFMGTIFRLVNTHLDSNFQEIRLEQLNELIKGPGNTNLPLFFIGDFNIDDTTYEELILEGFEDAWSSYEIDDGFTCCQGSDLLNSNSLLSERIDLIVYKNFKNIIVEEVYVVGDQQEDRTNTKLWPSDHAGVFAKFNINWFY